jgi:hypothetical protein
MNPDYLLKDLAVSNPVMRMLRSSENITGSREASSDGSRDDFNVIRMYIVGFVVTVLVAIGCIRLVYICLSTRRTVNATDAPELLDDDNSVHKTPTTTIAKRKQAILELFETSQVTMVSNDNKLLGTLYQNKLFTQRRKLTMCQFFQKVTDDDIHGEDGCVEDLESGFEEGGVLKLSRPVADIHNPTPAALLPPLPPPEWCEVPNMCAICLDSYQPGQIVAWSSECRHAFHQDCISHYLAKKMIGGESPCPSCRQKFCYLPQEPSWLLSSSIAGNTATTSE